MQPSDDTTDRLGLLEHLFEASSVPTQVYRPDARPCLTNGAFRALFSGAPPDFSLLGELSRRGGEVSEQVVRGFSGEPSHFTVSSHELTSGALRIELVPLRGAEGALVGVAAFVSESAGPGVTERKLLVELAAERDARAAADADRQRLRTLLDLAPANITVHEGEELAFVFSNARHQSMIGGRPVLGRALVDAVPELGPQGVVEQLKEVYRTGVSHEQKELAIHVVGELGVARLHFMNVAWLPLRNPSGATLGVMTFSYDVTEQVLARQHAERLAAALRESEELFRVAHEASPYGFVYYRSIRDAQDHVVDFEYVVQNAAASTINGLAPGRAVAGRRALEVSPGLETQAVWKHYVHVATTGEAWSDEVHCRGEHVDRWFQMTAVRVGDGIAVTFEDVSERKAAERARAELHATQQRVQREAEAAHARADAFYRQAPAAIAMWHGPQHTFQTANEGYLRMVGRQDVLGRNVRDVFPDANGVGSSLWDMYDRVYATGESITAPEYEMRFDRGDCIVPSFYSFTLGPMRDDRGQVEGLVAVAFDVTEQVRSREQNAALSAELGASEVRFRTAQEMSPDGFMMFRSVRADGVISDFAWAYTNPAAERMLGRTDAELVGKLLLNEMPGNLEEGLFAAYAVVVETGTPFRRELAYEHEGLSHAFRILAIRLGDGFAVTFEDVTERKRAEAERDTLLATLRTAHEEADAQRQQAETANRLKDEFLATISHELRTPLQAILGWSKILRTNADPTGERLRKGLEVIERNARSQASIIEDILDVSRIITGKLQLAIEDVDVVSVVEAAVDTLRTAAEAKRIALVLCMDAQHASIRADAGRLQQAVWNLVGNAIKFTPPGGSVRVEAYRLDHSIVVRVTDSGRGISADFLPHVFERFRQADGSSTREQGGLGLGLAIVRQLVELHGGSVRAQSEGEGRGATFELTIPWREGSGGTPPVAALHALDAEVHSSRDGMGVNLAGLRVVVVDDEEDVRELLAVVLREAGAEVRAVASAHAGLDCIRSAPPDLVFADISMPGQDGHAFMRSVRALDGPGRNVRAVALTASAAAADRAAALRAGFDEFLAKPTSPESLLATAARLAK